MTTTCPRCQLPQRVIDGKIEEHRISVDVAHSDFESIPCRCPGSGTAEPQAEGEPQRLVRENDFAQTRMAPDPNGQYILHSDHARIVAELRKALAEEKMFLAEVMHNLDNNMARGQLWKEYRSKFPGQHEEQIRVAMRTTEEGE